MATRSSARRLEGKVAVITGGASGSGEATARLFAQDGAAVVIADTQDELGESVAKSLGCTFFHCDVTVEADVAGVIDFAVEKHGKLDIMFNNATHGKPQASILEMELPEFERVLTANANAVGTFLGTKHAARAMIAGGDGGCIINVAAGAAGEHECSSCCSWRAVAWLTAKAAEELGRHGVRVNRISPASEGWPLASSSGVKTVVVGDFSAAAFYLAVNDDFSGGWINVTVLPGIGPAA